VKKKEPWYKDGLQFECTQCGKCCSGEPGFVWVDEHEIVAMAKAMEIDEAEFRAKFLRRVGERTSLIEYSDGDCILLDPQSRHCLAYAARPVQCRTWPFWDSNLMSRRTWAETCRVCPGAGEGKLYSIDQIEAARKQQSV
jgi:uncharacterized protein